MSEKDWGFVSVLERECVCVGRWENVQERASEKKHTADCEIDDWDWHDGRRLKFHLYMLIRLHRCITLQEKKMGEWMF